MYIKFLRVYVRTYIPDCVSKIVFLSVCLSVCLYSIRFDSIHGDANLVLSCIVSHPS